VATSRDQMRILFDVAKPMVASSPALKRRSRILINHPGEDVAGL
jgi:hypothetical protein